MDSPEIFHGGSYFRRPPGNELAEYKFLQGTVDQWLKLCSNLPSSLIPSSKLEVCFMRDAIDPE